jgi:hypothetical protein
MALRRSAWRRLSTPSATTLMFRAWPIDTAAATSAVSSASTSRPATNERSSLRASNANLRT